MMLCKAGQQKGGAVGGAQFRVRGPSGLLGEAEALLNAGVRCVVGVVERGLMRLRRGGKSRCNCV
jgi:hypothetical protein